MTARRSWSVRESDSITFQGGGGGGKEPKIVEMYKDYWMPMIDTADVVAARYNLSREYQDEYSLESQRRMAAAQQAGKFKDEIVPMATKMKVVNKETKEEYIVDYVVEPRRMQSPRHHHGGAFEARTRAKVPANSSRPAMPSQLSDGAAAVVVDGSEGSGEARPAADGRVQGLGGRGLRAG